MKGTHTMIDWIFTAFDTFSLKTLIAVILTVLLQLLICWKANKVGAKLLPAVILAAAVVFFSVCFNRIDHLISVIFLYFACQAFHLLLACGIGWGIWAFVRIMKRKIPSGTNEQTF